MWPLPRLGTSDGAAGPAVRVNSQHNKTQIPINSEIHARGRKMGFKML